MKILVIAPLQQENFDTLIQTFDDDEVIISSNKEATQEMFDKCDIVVGYPSSRFHINNENIKAVLLSSAGSDEFTKEGVLHPHTILANASGTYGKAISEHVIGCILALNKHFINYAHLQKQHQFQPLNNGKEIYHSTVLIVGLGDIGYQCAKRLKAFDCHIIGVKRRKTGEIPYVDEIYTQEDIDQVLPQADIVILSLPQSKETYHMFNRERLLSMKKDAVLVNVGRGTAIDTKALIDIMKQGHLYGAALDVFEEEPLPKDSELWDLDNLFITPHIAGRYEWASAREYYTQLVIRNIHHIKNNEPVENEVDFQTGYRKIVKY